MAMVNVAPVQVSVSCDPFTGTPRTVRAAGDQYDGQGGVTHAL